MALLAAQQVQITGTTITFAAAAGGGDTVSPDDRAMLEIKNAGSQITATVVVPGTLFGQALADVAVIVPATTGHVRIGPLTRDLADPTTGLINITYSGVTSVTVAIVRA